MEPLLYTGSCANRK